MPLLKVNPHRDPRPIAPNGQYDDGILESVELRPAGKDKTKFTIAVDVQPPGMGRVRVFQDYWNDGVKRGHPFYTAMLQLGFTEEEIDAGIDTDDDRVKG